MKKTGIGKGIIYVLYTVLLVLFLVPFFLVLLNSFKVNKEIILNPLAFPEKINFYP